MAIHRNDKSAFENYKVCYKCGGKCCLNSPCILDKSDIKSYNPSDIASTVLERKFAIHTLDNPDLYRRFNYFDFPYLYITSKGEYDLNVNMLTIYGACLNLTDHGCTFSSKERPMGGRLLVPDKNHNCSYQNKEDLYNLIYSWKEFQDNLKEAVQIMTGCSAVDLATSQYESVLRHEEEFYLDPLLSHPTVNYKRSYHYCELVRQYGFKLSYNVMDLLDVVACKLPDSKEAIFESLRQTEGIETMDDLEVKNILLRSVM